ncbi:MAG: hypothetical protein ACREM1_03145, partial [Longimicrobiales bacterium]
AAALAGASAFLNPGADAAQRARHYATLNDIRGVPIDAEEVTVTVFGVDSINVRVRRESVPLWFARLFGFTARPVAAAATAGTAPANSANCVAPLAFDFEWDPAQEGVSVIIAPEGEGPAKHEYITLDFLPKWENTNFEPCPNGDPISLEPPGQVGVGPPPIRNWAWELYSKDPEAAWHLDTGINSRYGWSSPRIVTVMLYRPLSDQMVEARDFLLFFVESASPDSELVEGKFLRYASGSGEGPSKTMLTLQLTR